MKIAYFISPHGFGHAARACAVMEAWNAGQPNMAFEVFTTVPEWFFNESLTCQFRYHRLLTDIGLVQKDPLHVDLPATLRALTGIYPCSKGALAALARQLRGLDCEAIVCDISPLGLEAARIAGLPAILVENFTWDWIYHGYVSAAPELAPFVEYFAAVNAEAALRIQTAPVCASLPHAVHTAPVGRAPRMPRKATRGRLQINDGSTCILVTMGGFVMDFDFLEPLRTSRDFTFILLGPFDAAERDDNLLRFPQHSGFYHPDLVAAADVVVSKLGYSTAAEIYYSNAAYLYIDRPGFREAAVIRAFAERELRSMELTEQEFYRASWIGKLSELARRRSPAGRGGEPGTLQVVKAIRNFL